MLRHSLVIAVAFAWPAQATARPAPQVARQIGALQECKATSDNVARLACFDREVASLLAATQSQDVVIVERGEVRKARKGLFGFSLPNLGFLTGRDDNDEDKSDAARLETKIISSRTINYGKWQFTVEDGAIWNTVEADTGFDDPLPGRTVVIERGSLGSYFAKVGRGRRVQAKRIQ